MSGNITDWIGIIFGWPFVLIGLSLAVVALIKRKPWTYLLVAVLLSPTSLYLSGSNTWIGSGALLILPMTLLCIVTLKKGLIKTTAVLTVSLALH